MNKIQIFRNEEFGEIRTLEINGQCYFVGTDVAKALGYANPRDAIRKHVDNEDKQLLNIQMFMPNNTVAKCDGIQKRGNPNVIVINESDLYSLILSSKLDRSKKFKHWVTSKVLPSIRRTGTYGITDIEKVVDKMIEEKTEAVINRVLDKKINYIIKTLDEHSDKRIKEAITEISCTTAQSLIPCFIYTHKKIKELHDKLKDE